MPRIRSGQPIHRNSVEAGTFERTFWRRIPTHELRQILTGAEIYERNNRKKGSRSGPLGPVGLELLHLLGRLQKKSKVGQLCPTYDWVKQHLKRSKDAISNAYARLERHGLIERIRRSERQADGSSRQTSTAYRILIPIWLAATLPASMGPVPQPDDVVVQAEEVEAERFTMERSLSLPDYAKHRLEPSTELDALVRLGNAMRPTSHDDEVDVVGAETSAKDEALTLVAYPSAMPMRLPQEALARFGVTTQAQSEPADVGAPVGAAEKLVIEPALSDAEHTSIPPSHLLREASAGVRLIAPPQSKPTNDPVGSKVVAFERQASPREERAAEYLPRQYMSARLGQAEQPARPSDDVPNQAQAGDSPASGSSSLHGRTVLDFEEARLEVAIARLRNGFLSKPDSAKRNESQYESLLMRTNSVAHSGDGSPPKGTEADCAGRSLIAGRASSAPDAPGGRKTGSPGGGPQGRDQPCDGATARIEVRSEPTQTETWLGYPEGGRRPAMETDSETPDTSG